MKKTGMQRGRLVGLLPAALLAAMAWRSVVAVDETELAIVTQFGRPVTTIRDPGLALILPYRSVIRFDRRLQMYDPRPSEFLTRDPKNILLDVYVCWQINDPLVFLQRATDRAGAEARLHDIVWAELAAEIGKRELAELVSEEPGVASAAAILERVRDRCRRRAVEAAGVEVVDVRLKRINLPEQNKQSVFDRMRAERDRIARQYRAEGEEKALQIRADAERERDRILAEAERDADKRRGEATKEAIRIYAGAHAADPEFYRFVRSLEAYRSILNTRSTLVLSADSELFRYLDSPEPAPAEPVADPREAP